MRIIVAIVFLIVSFLGRAQTSSENWKTLSLIEYEKSSDEYGEIYVPNFGTEIKNLEGREIELSGYIIPFEGMFKPDHLIISSVPVASCFFCGGSGPESVAEVDLKESVKYTAKKVTIKGKLKLNSTDVDQLMYILEEATMETN